MSTDTSRWGTAAEELLARTERGALKWEIARLNRPAVIVLGAAFRTVHVQCTDRVKEYRIAVYEYQREAGPYEAVAGRWSSSGILVSDPVRDVAIEFVDSYGAMVFRWPQASARWKLIEAIRFQSAEAEDFLKGFLGESAGT